MRKLCGKLTDLISGHDDIALPCSKVIANNTTHADTSIIKAVIGQNDQEGNLPLLSFDRNRVTSEQLQSVHVILWEGDNRVVIVASIGENRRGWLLLLETNLLGPFPLLCCGGNGKIVRIGQRQSAAKQSAEGEEREASASQWCTQFEDVDFFKSRFVPVPFLLRSTPRLFSHLPFIFSSATPVSMPRGQRKRKSTCAAEPSRRPSPLLQYLQTHSHNPAGFRSSPSSARRSSHDPTIESEDIKETLAGATSLPSSGPRFIPVSALVAITVVQLLTSAPCGQHAVSSEPNERALHDRERFVLQPPCHPPNEREVRFRAERRWS
jgi:hypothetical protein